MPTQVPQEFADMVAVTESANIPDLGGNVVEDAWLLLERAYREYGQLPRYF